MTALPLRYPERSRHDLRRQLGPVAHEHRGGGPPVAAVPVQTPAYGPRLPRSAAVLAPAGSTVYRPAGVPPNPAGAHRAQTADEAARARAVASARAAAPQTTSTRGGSGTGVGAAGADWEARARSSAHRRNTAPAVLKAVRVVLFIGLAALGAYLVALAAGEALAAYAIPTLH